MLEKADLSIICGQYIIQMSMFFLANVEERIRTASSEEDDTDIMAIMSDFRAGFDQRMQLLVINHVLLNFDKSMMNGAVFNKLLNVKTPGEWLALVDKIKLEHFSVKNKADYSGMSNKILKFCDVSRIFRDKFIKNVYLKSISGSIKESRKK